MHKAKIYKAQGIGKQEVESLQIEFSEEIPHFRELVEARIIFANEGQRLEFLLYHALPGGTYDHLLGTMLKRKASHFIVSHGGLTDVSE